jgi:hypothetical protein
VVNGLRALPLRLTPAGPPQPASRPDLAATRA